MISIHVPSKVRDTEREQLTSGAESTGPLAVLLNECLHGWTSADSDVVGTVCGGIDAATEEAEATPGELFYLLLFYSIHHLSPSLTLQISLGRAVESDDLSPLRIRALILRDRLALDCRS